MKTRFSTIDIRSSLCELKKKFLGLRVVNVYDIDNKTYLIKVAKPDHKGVILLESGNRIHSTEYDWPKNTTPSGFSMKLRKHLRGRRLESVTQLGIDRIVDLQFGSNEAAYHIILELYDRGNIVLTDHEYCILNILRARTDESQDVRFAVRETYQIEGARQHEGLPSQERLMEILLAGKDGDNIRKILNPHLVYGPALIDHALLSASLPENARLGKEFTIQNDVVKVMAALHTAEIMLQKTGEAGCKGYIIQKREKKPVRKDGEPEEDLLTYSEFHPFLFKQHENQAYLEFDEFNKAVDEFFSKMESQKLDMKALQQEKMALKKLENVRKDHEKRLEALQKEQDTDALKGQLIEMNLPLVDRAIMIVQSAVANQIDWDEIDNIVKQAQAHGDPVAQTIKSLKLQTNHITLLLKDTCIGEDDLDLSGDDTIKPMKIDIDLGLSAYANARRYYDMKRHAAKKEQKTMDASHKAFKSAESKTKQTLKEIQTTATIIKSRKTAWFEKFIWFITSENYLVIGGRDQQQNELIVKRHLRPGDLYVHADLHGASSVVIKNPSGTPVPPKSLNEAGTMALCSSAAWEAKVVTSAWWVYHDQVSKTAPTGEYLTTGSFMIRGKKNFLPPSFLIYGFGFLFKVDETSIFRHKDERRVRVFDDESRGDAASVAESATESEMSEVSLDNKLESMDTGDYSDDEGSEDAGELLKTDEPANLELEKKPGSDESDCKVRQSDGVDADDEINEDEEDDDDDDDDEDDGDDGGGDSDDGDNAGDDNADVGRVSVKQDSSSSDQRALKQSDSVARLADDEEESDDVSLFPDTNIQLQYVSGGKYELHRSKQESSASGIVYLGDDKPIVLENVARPVSAKTQARISAKQRRDLKKKSRHGVSQPDVVDEGEVSTDAGYRADREDTEEQKRRRKHRQGPPSSQPQQPPPKRGQKAKLKKIKEKYGDQDEEERQLRMEILASAGGSKEKQKKGKKGKQQQQQQQKAQSQNQPTQKKGGAARPQGRLTADDIKLETLTVSAGQKQRGDEGNLSDEEKQAVMEDENITLVQEADVLDSLTGQPHVEDILLYAIPVCAPYSTLNNYKYKVKLIPGSTKRGKAAKIALNMFMHDKNATSREKDLFRSLKDVDMSRNMPGKVKVSAPNLHKQKHK